MNLKQEKLEMAEKATLNYAQMEREKITSNQTLSSFMTQQTQETDLRDSNQALTHDSSNYGSEGNFVNDADPSEETHFDRYDHTLWDRKVEYILTCSSFVVGIKSVLQFPALAAKHGGGSFYFVYLFLVCIMGVPILYLEMCLGQYVHGGPIKAWTVMPLVEGIGYGMILLTGLISMFYNTYSAWALFYLFSSFTATLPWETVNKVNNSTDSVMLSPAITASRNYLHHGDHTTTKVEPAVQVLKIETGSYQDLYQGPPG